MDQLQTKTEAGRVLHTAEIQRDIAKEVPRPK